MISEDNVIEGSHNFMVGSLLHLSHHPAKFGGARHCDSGDLIFLAIEEQAPTCSCLNPPLLFISNAHGILGSHTRRLTIKGTLMKRLASVSNE